MSTDGMKSGGVDAEDMNMGALCADGMVLIPEGDIRMRDDRKKCIWQVHVRPFLLHRHPVTQACYMAVTGGNPSVFTGDGHPMDSVSWLEAVAFCNALSQREGLPAYYEVQGEHVTPDASGSIGYRLPTEAEWQYACQTGTDDVRYGELDEIAWFARNAGGSTHPAGLKRPNAWGLHDMLGNVWEWCWDLYDEKVYGSYRIFRGGGWSDEERGCLATNRRRGHPTFRIDDLGFRVARSIAP